MTIKTVAVHNGIFHADDAFAVSVLRLAGLQIQVVRTRDLQTLTDADYRVDVGGRNDPETNDFDHHQKGGAGDRSNGVPFAAFGLLWEYRGRSIIRRFWGAEPPTDVEVEAVHDAVDRSLVQPVDAADNGHEIVAENVHNDVRPFTVSHAISLFNPGWDEDGTERDDKFDVAANMARRILLREVVRAIGVVRARTVVDLCLMGRPDPRILILPQFVPWQDALFAADPHGEKVLYIVFPSETGDWRLQCCPPEKGSFDKKRPLPDAWAGLRGDDLAALTGVQDAVFCHPGRFIAGAQGYEGIMRLAEMALADDERGLDAEEAALANAIEAGIDPGPLDAEMAALANSVEGSLCAVCAERGDCDVPPIANCGHFIDENEPRG